MPSAQGTPVDPAGAGTAAGARPHRAPSGPILRTPVAVVVSRFPLVTETFILREIQELERQGQPVVLVPLLRERGPLVHREAEPWVQRALYTPFLSPRIAAANLRCLRRQPRTYLRVLGQLVRGNVRSVALLARALALFPKSVFLAERLAAERVGHVHAHFATHPALAAWVVSTLAGIPYSVTAHAHDLFVRRDMLDVKLAGARFVRCISEFNRRFLSERVPALRGALRVVHMGVPLPEGQTAPPPAPRLLCVAALKPYKGHAVLVEACARLRARGVDFTCDLVGDGPLRSTVRSAVARAGLEAHVRLLGALPQHEVAALLAQATVVVQPSVVAADGQMEGIPVALMEAMAARKPVVASALSGVPELVEDGVSGLLVPPADAAALAEAVERVLLQPEVARWMGEQGRRKVEREFTLDDTVRQLLDALDPHRLPAPASWRELVGAVGGSWPALGLRQAQERPESSVAELLLPAPEGAPPGGPRELVLKVHHGPQGERSPRTARREFQALAALEHQLDGASAGASGAVRLGTPVPLGLDESEGAVLMAACTGEPMDALVRRSRWRGAVARTSALRAAGLAGAWLRALQEKTAEAADDGRLEALCDGARADLAAAALPPALADRVRGRLETLPARLLPESRTAVGMHGDFWPGNVFVGERSLQVVDLEGFGRGLPYEDAAYFAVQLGLFYSYPPLRARGRRMRDAFVEGWRPNAALDAAAWTLCLTAKALQVLVHTREAALGRPRSAWRKRALHAALWAAGP